MFQRTLQFLEPDAGCTAVTKGRRSLVTLQWMHSWLSPVRHAGVWRECPRKCLQHAAAPRGGSCMPRRQVSSEHGHASSERGCHAPAAPAEGSGRRAVLGGLCSAAGAALVLPTRSSEAAASSLDQLNILRRRGEVSPSQSSLPHPRFRTPLTWQAHVPHASSNGQQLRTLWLCVVGPRNTRRGLAEGTLARRGPGACFHCMCAHSNPRMVCCRWRTARRSGGGA